MGSSGVYNRGLQPFRNLSDVASVATSRTNLGVTASGADTTYNYRVNNLSDVASVATARTNLGVTATGADTTYNYRANNLSDVASVATARTNLGVDAIAAVVHIAGTETITGTKTFTPASTYFGNGNAGGVSSGAGTVLNGGEDGSSSVLMQANGSNRWSFGRNLTGAAGGSDLYFYSFAYGFSATVGYTSGQWNFGVAPLTTGKAFLSHGSAYTSGQVTYSTSSPSGGADGDIWFQYV